MTYGAYPAGQASGRTRPGPLCPGHRGSPSARVGDLAPLPSIESIDALIDAAFWTSLRREEVLRPEHFAGAPAARSDVPQPLRLRATAAARRRPPSRESRRRSSVPASTWASWPDGDGDLRSGAPPGVLPHYCLVLEVAAPGLLVVKQQRGGEQTEVRATSRCSKATRSSSSTRTRRACPTARRC